MDGGKAKIGKDLSADSGIMLHRLMADVRDESRLISPMGQQLPMSITRHAWQAGSRLVQIQENSAVRFGYLTKSRLNQLAAIAVQ
jgi:hypothetical protein